jgi:AcrR family transcriptional regulator
MRAVTPSAELPVRRRTPTQTRSRERVERILDEASRIVVTQGADALNTRTVASAAEVPVASLYQYFADRDAILLALVERDTAEMDEQVLNDLATSPPATIAEMATTTMQAYVSVYARRPSFVEIWLRGRTNPAIDEYCRQHNRRTARELLDFAIASGLAAPTTPLAAIELAVEIGDRVFQLAYESDGAGDAFVIAEGITMVTSYLQTYAPGGSR